MYKYFSWHYTKGIKSFLEIWRDFIEFFWHYFSVSLLVRTLFSHWKRDITPRARGFDPQEFFQRLAFNLISRFLGAVVRSAVILFALFLEILTIVLGSVFFLIWLILPVAIFGFFLGAIIFALTSKFIFALIFILIAILLFALPGYFYANSKIKFPSKMSLEEMMNEPWFDLVWQRAGVEFLTDKKPTLQEVPQILQEKDLSVEDFNHIVFWVARTYEEKEKVRRFWLRENLLTSKGIGKDWAYGYTVNLDRFSKELSFLHTGRNKFHLYGREKEIEIIERVLARAEENNILVIGEPGTGRKTVIEGFAEMVYQGKVLPPLKHKRVLELDLGAVVAGSLNESEMEARLIQVLNEAVRAGNIILVIDDFHNFVGRQEGLGKLDIVSTLMPYLSSRYIQIIGIVTYEGLHKNIEANPELLKFFEKVEIKEPDEQNILLILEDVVSKLEERVSVRTTYKALQEIIAKSGQYFADISMPERAIDLLDEALIYVATKTNDRFLMPKHVDLILSEKTEIPIGEISSDEKEKLAKLEEILHQRIINQEEAIKSIASAMRRARMGIGEKKKPIGSFLFLGPTGVGKTETAKALAETYFGKPDSTNFVLSGREEKMIRLDMSEYQNIQDIERLIGRIDGEPGYLVTQIREDPFSLVLLDEIEKAHTNILNLFLQVLDEGFLTDAWGRRISFRNAIIIATSNAGTEYIREMVEKGVNPTAEKEKILDFLQKNNIFRPEFLNRFDGVVIFHPLTKDNLIKIAELLLKGLAKRLAEQKIDFIITPTLCEKIAELGYNPEYGARPMRRVIQDRIEDLISKKMLEGKIGKGSRVEIGAEEI